MAREEHRLPNDRAATFDVIRHPGGAAVLPILDDGRLLLIRQYRPAVGAMVYEIPAGRLEPGESPLACACRELAEEAGCRAGQTVPLGGLWSAVGYCDEFVHLFLATELTAVPPAPEPDEVVEPCPMSLADALAKLAAGEIPDSKTQVALLRYSQLQAGASQ